MADIKGGNECKCCDGAGVPWGALRLWWLDTGRELMPFGGAWYGALEEFRRTGGMYMVVLCDPEGMTGTPEECERMSEAGPEAREVCWRGFAEALAASRGDA
jgi:hypothetical protein